MGAPLSGGLAELQALSPTASRRPNISNPLGSGSYALTGRRRRRRSSEMASDLDLDPFWQNNLDWYAPPLPASRLACIISRHLLLHIVHRGFTEPRI